MKLSWYQHPEPLDHETANELLSLYALRKIPTKRTLAADPRLWLVSALLPDMGREPRQDRTYQQPIWSRL